MRPNFNPLPAFFLLRFAVSVPALAALVTI